jgi:TolB-like protein
MRISSLLVGLLLLLVVEGVLYAQETSEVVEDWSPPQLTAVSILSNNTNTAYAKVGDTVWVYFTVNEPIDPASVNVKILGQAATLYRNKGNQTLSKYIVMDNNNPEGLIDFSISNYMDPAGNEGSPISTVTNGSTVMFDRTAPKITISDVNVTGGNVVPKFFNKTNTGVTITVPINNDASIINSSLEIIAKVNGKDAGSLGTYTIASSDLGRAKKVTAQNNNDLGNFGEGTSITFYGIVSDVAGNTTTSEESSISIRVDKSAPKIGNKRIYSNSVDPTKAGLGDIVYVEFTASEKIDTVAATIGGQPIGGLEHIRDFTSRIWRQMTSADTEGILSFSLSGGDAARNMSAATATVFDGSKVEFSSSGLKILSTIIGSNSSYGDTLAKPGDEITVEITTDMPLIVKDATISGQPAAVDEPGENKYLFSIVVADQEQVGLAQFVIDYTDQNDIPYDKLTAVTDNSYVRFYGTRPIFEEVTITASGADPAIAAVNDEIQLTFRIQDARLDSSSLTIMNKPPQNITVLGQDTYRASYVLTETDPEGRIEFTITALDPAGNSSSVTATTNNSYVVFDQAPPADFTVGQVSASGGTVVENEWNSTNKNVLVTIPIDSDLSLIGGGVQVLVSFDGSDTLEIGSAVAISKDNIGNPIVVTLSKNEFTKAQYFAAGATALFTARIHDFAGYERIGTSSSNQLLINEVEEKSIVESIAMASSNKSYTKGAKAGDVISLIFLTNEQIQNPVVTIAGEPAVVVGFGTNWFATKTMAAGDSEGVVQFNFSPVDMNGNTRGSFTETTDGSQIVYDNTAPDINHLYEGNFTQDEDNILTTDSLALGMAGGDSVSGVAEFYFGLGTSPGATDVVPWTKTKSIRDTLLTGLTLQFNVQYYASAYAIDRLGNKSETISGDGFVVTDGSPLTDQPETVVESISIASSNRSFTQGAKAGDVISLIIRTKEQINSPVVMIGGESANVVGFGDNWFATRTMAPSDSEGVVPFHFTPEDLNGDLRGLHSATTDGSQVLFDNTAPVISHLYEGSFTQDRDNILTTDSLYLGMAGSDPLSGIKQFYFALGKSPGAADVVPWIRTNSIADTLLTGLTLQSDVKYFASAYAIDRVGNKSETISGDGFMVNFIPPKIDLPVAVIDDTPKKLRTVAILDFEGKGINAQEVQTLTERMRTEIGNTNAVRLIERKAIENIMAEQGLAQSGCVTDECAAEVGQLLGVQYMINGVLGKMGDSYTIDAKMFSVETGETVQAVNTTYEGEIEGLLLEMQILSWEIVGLEVPPRLKLQRAGETEKPTMAVIDFDGRGISVLEAQTLTDRFTTELDYTDRVRMVDRRTMTDVLVDQGFSAGECTSEECAAEVGAALGVEFMINGSIGKIGNTYTIDCKMFSVATGAAENMKNLSYQGEVDGLITEMEILAWDILDLTIPQNLIKKRQMGTRAFLESQAFAAIKTKQGALLRSAAFPGLGQLYSDKKMEGYAFIGLEVILLGLTLSNNSAFNSAQSDYNSNLASYNAASTQDEIANYRALVIKADQEMVKRNNNLLLFSSLTTVVWIGNMVHAYLTGPEDVEARSDDREAALPIRIAYDPYSQQTMLKWEFDL